MFPSFWFSPAYKYTCMYIGTHKYNNSRHIHINIDYYYFSIMFNIFYLHYSHPLYRVQSMMYPCHIALSAYFNDFLGATKLIKKKKEGKRM